MSPSATEPPQEIPADVQAKKLATEQQPLAGLVPEPAEADYVKPVAADTVKPATDEQVPSTPEQKLPATDDAVKPIADDAVKPVTDGEVKEQPEQDDKLVTEKTNPVEKATSIPELRTDHKEPLKLSGALDQFEHFDVTPVIGREYSNVKLYDLLRAPNSDELLRDLAITSTLSLHMDKAASDILGLQSPSVASSSSASKTRSTTTSRRSWSSA